MSDQSSPGLGGAIWSIWALLLGIGILMLGDGLQATLLAVRADQEGFSTTTTGLIMSAFFVGFLSGSMLTPKIMMQVGHIRVFAALAAMASAAILVHAVFLDVWVWIGLRLVSGFCFAGLYVVAESWLNERATNQTRGKLLSLYMVITYVGVGLGQLLLNLSDPQGYPLFVLTSILISIAVVPLLLSGGAAPKFSESVPIGIKALFKLSPLGMVTMFVEGFVTATFFALGPVYAQRLGLDVKSISWFMAAAVFGTVVLQWPIGAISDRFDRRIVLTVLLVLAAIASFAMVTVDSDNLVVLLISVAVFAGLALPLYSLCIAYTNDRLETNQMIAASGTLVLVNGLGSIAGPLLVAVVMDLTGNQGLWLAIGFGYALTALFALYRISRRKFRPIESDDDWSGHMRSAIRPSSSAVEWYHADEEQEDAEPTRQDPG